MAIIDDIRKMFGLQTEKKQNGSLMGYFNVGTQEKMYKYQDLAKEGYMKNAIVYRCVNEISKGASAVPYQIKIEDNVLEDTDLHRLLDRPNPLQSYSEFFNSLYGYLLLSGNAYVLKVGSENGPPKELHLLRPDRIVIKGGTNYIPERYEYMVNGRIDKVYPVDQENGYSEVKHIKLWNPLDDYYGCSPLTAAAMEIDQHNLSSKHNVNLLNNGARPSGAVVFKPKDDQGLSVNLTESQRQQLLTDLNNRFSGASNAGRPLLLEGDFDWKEMGLSPKDMDFINLKHMSATDIALCFGVPSQLVGVPDSQTYSNVAEARLALYEETIIPYLRKVSSDLNEWLLPMFGENLDFSFETDNIPALAERRRLIYANVTNAVREGIITRNEARERLGLSPVDGGNELYISANLFPLGSEPLPPPDNEKDFDEYDELDDVLEDDFKNETKATNFPKRGEDKKISLRNSNYPQFDYDFAKNVKEDGGSVGKQIWKAGGNIRGNEAFTLWGRAKAGDDTPAIRKWIKEREAWAARHSVVDGNQFVGGKEPNLSNVAGVVALMKWGVINPKLGQQGMKDVILELTKKLEGRKEPEEKEEPLPSDVHIEIAEEEKQVSARVKEALKNKVKEHNDKYGDDKTKRATLGMLEKVFRRGVGAFNTNPSSVRPGVRRQGGADRWAYARTNSFLFALRRGRFQGGKHDTDLFPTGHPLKAKGPTDSQGRPKK
jgi:HK97 family phage portal protein